MPVTKATFDLTDKHGEVHHFPVNDKGLPVIPGEAQLKEYLECGGDPLIHMQVSPNRPAGPGPNDSPNPAALDDTTSRVNSALVNKAIADAEHSREDATTANMIRQFEDIAAMQTGTKSYSDAEERKSEPGSDEEWQQRAWAAHAKAASIGFDLVVLNLEKMAMVTNVMNQQVEYSKPLLELRPHGMCYGYAYGTLQQIEECLNREVFARAKKAHLEKVWADYADSKRREYAEEVASTPQAQLARLKAEHDAEMARQKAELADTNYRLNKLIARNAPETP